MKIKLFFCLGIFFFIGCKKSQVGNTSTIVEVTPLTPNIDFITKKVDALISNQINLILSSGVFDFKKTLELIEAVEGVKDGSLNQEQSAITVTMTNDLIFNFLLTTRDDDEQFTDLKLVAGISQPIKQIDSKLSNTSVKINATGNTYVGKNILILAPFQRKFNEPLSDYKAIFQSIGVNVTILCDEDVNLDVFKNNYLQKFDFIYISTHGDDATALQNKQIATVLATGIVYDDDKFYNIPKEERDLLGIMTIKNLDKSYLAISAPYLQKFNTQKFNHSFIFANACKSFLNTDLALYFYKNGVSDYSGFTGMINSDFANLVGGSLLMDLAIGGVGRDVFYNYSALTKITSQYRLKATAVNINLYKIGYFGIPEAQFIEPYTQGSAGFTHGYGQNGQTDEITGVWLNFDDKHLNKNNFLIYDDNSTISFRPVSIGQSIDVPRDCGIQGTDYSGCWSFKLENVVMSFNEIVRPRPVYYYIDFKQSGAIKKTWLAMYLSLGH